MSGDDSLQLDAFITPGTLLKSAREAMELTEREVADRLHLMPGYPAIIERDDFKALRHPAFARGYVEIYGKLVGVDTQQLLAAFDRLRAEAVNQEPKKKVRTKPIQLQRTGLGVVVGLALLALMVFAIWWSRAVPQPEAKAVALPSGGNTAEQQSGDYSLAGEQ